MEASDHQLVFYTVIRKFGYLRNSGTSLWNFAPNSGDLENFANAIVQSTKLVDVELVDHTYDGRHVVRRP